MGNVKLFCLLPGRRLEQSFGVKLFRKSDVDDLRKCIIAECGGQLGGVSHGNLRLYRISIIDDSELARLDVQDNPPFLPRTITGTLFPGIPGENK